MGKANDTQNSLRVNDSKLSVSSTLSYESCQAQTDFTWNGTDLSTILIDLQNKIEENRLLEEQICEKDRLICQFTSDKSASNDNGMNTSQSTSQMPVPGSEDSSDSSSSSAESDEDGLDSLTGSVNSANGHHCSTSEESLAVSILEAVRQNDRNNLSQVLRKCQKNNFPQSRKISDVCWDALRLAASSQSHKKCLESLLKYKNGVLVSLDDRIAEHISSQADVEENILLLLQKGYEFHERSAGKSILHFAAHSGKTKIISCLSKHSASINVKDSLGFTPLHYSASHGDLEGTRILLENGADVRLADNSGSLPLHGALEFQPADPAIVRLLVERDLATINHANNRSETPFFAALRFVEDLSLISYLLEKGGRNVDIDRSISTFHIAISHHRYDLLPLLLESIPIGQIEKYCSSDIWNNIDMLSVSFDDVKTIVPLTCSAIDIGANCLALLISRDLPKHVLQAPYLLQVEVGIYKVLSPLAYLFIRYFVPRDERFDPCLDMLLEHKITMMDEFQRAHRLNWLEGTELYIHPFEKIFHPSVSPPDQLHYFNLLNANQVTTDYCLQCYYDNTEPFISFNELLYQILIYYKFVGAVAKRGDTEAVKLLISASDILEPNAVTDLLCFLTNGDERKNLSSPIYKKIGPVLEYLVSLKPIYLYT